MGKMKGWIWFIILVAIALLFMYAGKKIAPTEPSEEQDKGVTMKVYKSDKYGNIISEIKSFATPGLMAVVEGESGVDWITIKSTITNQDCSILAEADCDSPCVWETSTCFGGADIIVTRVTGTNDCVADPGCAIPNNYMCDTPPCTDSDADDDGDIDGIYRDGVDGPATDFTLLIGESDDGLDGTGRKSGAIGVNELALGQIRFRLDVLGTYVDEDGITQTLPSTFGYVDLNIVPANCPDSNTNLGFCVNFTAPGNDIYRGYSCQVLGETPTEIPDSTNCGCCTPGNPGDTTCAFQEKGDETCEYKKCSDTDQTIVNTCLKDDPEYISRDGSPTVFFCELQGDGTVTLVSYCNDLNGCDGDGPDNIFETIDDECGINGYGDYAKSCKFPNNPSECKFPPRGPRTVVSLVQGSTITLREYYETDTSGTSITYGNNFVGQTFTIGAVGPVGDFTITSVELKGYKVGSPGIYTVGIRNVDGSNLPTGLDISTGQFDGNSISTTAVWIPVDMSPSILTNGMTYAIVINGAGDISNNVIIRQNAAGTYLGGNKVVSGDGGNIWGLQSGVDLAFRVYGKS